ncbi:MAG: inorganic diphosphatase [Candidatus Saccharibacteria bacterium]
MSLLDMTYGEKAPNIVNTVIENSKGSRLKIEFDRELDNFVLDRVHQTHLGSPSEYGFVPSTLDEDGDALDVLLISDDPMPMGLIVPTRVIGVMYMIDSGEVDNKLVGVPADDKHYDDIQTIEDVSEHWKKAVQHYFEHYKDLKGDKVEIKGFAGIDEATKIFNECVERYNNK